MSALADDMLHGARQISLYVFGRDDRKYLRKVYYKVENREWPVWTDGQGLVSRKSELDRHFQKPVIAA